ncbi:hypothetical protein COY95_04475, partial [Candidatus Woesearchaeota archaeon CG_4_10_14_0_8_um_filter_47_5]
MTSSTPVSYDKLRKEQTALAKKLVLKDRFEKIQTIAGIEHLAIGTSIFSQIVVCDAHTLGVLDKKYAVKEVAFPNVSGLLAYRLLPAALDAYQRLQRTPDIILVMGHGVLHPRGCGFASHLGLVLDKPTIGIAHKLIAGTIDDDNVLLKGKVMGKLLHTKDRSHP